MSQGQEKAGNMPEKTENPEKKRLLGGFFEKGKQKPGKGLYYKLGIILVVGLLLMSLGNWSFPGGDSHNQPEDISAAVASPRNDEELLEAKLQSILGKIKGAGDLEVAITFASNGSRNYAFNETLNESTSTEQGAAEGGVRDSRTVSTSQDLVLQNDNPVVVEEYTPAVKGVLVVAQGAADPMVKRELFLAVQGLLGLEAHKIVITEGK